MRSSNKRIVKNSVFMAVRMVIVLCLNFITTRLVLSSLGVEDYGIYNVVCGFVAMFSFFSTSMANGIQRFFNYEYGKNGIVGANKVFNTAMIIQTLTAIIILVLIESIGIWYLHAKMVVPIERIFAAECIFHFSVASFIITIIQAPFVAVIMAHEKMDFYALVSVLDAVLKIFIAYLITIVFTDKLITYGFLLLLISLFDIVIYIWYIKKNFLQINIKFRFYKDLFYSMLKFSGWNMFGSFAGIMKEQGINLMLNLFFGPVINAARGIANQINGGLQSFVQNLSVPIRPQVIKSYAIEDYERTLSLTFNLSKFSCCLIYFISLPIILEINYILNIWLGDNIPPYTNTFVIIIIFITYINNLNSPVSGIIHASGNMKTYQLVTSLISLLCLPSTYVFLIMGYSPEIALIMVLIFGIISQYAALKILQRVIKFDLSNYMKNVLFPFFCLVLLTILIPLLPVIYMEQSFLRLVVVTLVSSLSIIIGFYFIILNKTEKVLFKNMIFKIFNNLNK